MMRRRSYFKTPSIDLHSRDPKTSRYENMHDVSQILLKQPQTLGVVLEVKDPHREVPQHAMQRVTVVWHPWERSRPWPLTISERCRGWIQSSCPPTSSSLNVASVTEVQLVRHFFTLGYWPASKINPSPKAQMPEV